MRIGSVDGTPEEIKDLVENHGLKLDDYLQKPEQPEPRLNTKWIVIPCLLFGASVITLSLMESVRTAQPLFGVVFSFLLLIWAALALHVRYDKTALTITAVILGFICILLAVGVVPPTEAAELLKEATSD